MTATRLPVLVESSDADLRWLGERLKRAEETTLAWVVDTFLVSAYSDDGVVAEYGAAPTLPAALADLRRRIEARERTRGAAASLQSESS